MKYEYLKKKEEVKMTKCWKTNSSGLGKMPATNCVLKKMTAPNEGLVDCSFFFLTIYLDFS